MLTSTPSRRLSERYGLQLVTRFCWITPQGDEHTADGITRDVGSNGAYIDASVCPPLHAQVRFEMQLPAISQSAPELRISAAGEVCRIDTSDTKIGFAVRSARKFRVTRISRQGSVLQ